jgi:hypothetical protein
MTLFILRGSPLVVAFRALVRPWCDRGLAAQAQGRSRSRRWRPIPDRFGPAGVGVQWMANESAPYQVPRLLSTVNRVNDVRSALFVAR